MNGNTVFDSNVIIDLFNGLISLDVFIKEFSGNVQFVSIITRIELLAFPKISKEQEEQFNEFLSTRFIIPINKEVETATIKVRRLIPSVKLPDAIIAATALVLDATLITSDDKLLQSGIPNLKLFRPACS